MSWGEEWAPEAPAPLVDLDALLRHVAEGGGSDLHLTVGAPPTVRVRGEMTPVPGTATLTAEDLREALYAVMTERQRQVLEETRELDFAYAVPGLARFRVNVFWQREAVGAVMRLIPWRITPLEDLGMPPVVETFGHLKRGLVLVTGPTGSGKSTTLAAMLDQINRTRRGHIMTIEDPIEFLHQHQGCLVNQREVGADTLDFRSALKHVLRQDPDVVLVGEMRDFETIETAITAAETGHLVMSTLHTVDAAETIHRVISAFPPYHQKQIRLQLASVLKAVISQRLVPRADGEGRVPALEVMISTGLVRECIADEERVSDLPDVIAKGFTSYGMQTFDQSLMQLLKEGLVTYEEALKHVSNPDDFALRFRGIDSTSDSRWDDFSGKRDSEDPATLELKVADEVLEIERF